MNEYRYLGQSITMEDKTAQEVEIKIKAGWSVFGRYREIFLDEDIPINLKKKVFNQCVLPTMTYGCQTWTLTKDIIHRLRVSQRAMERKILNIKIKDRISNRTIRERTKVDDVIKVVTKAKWRWAGHVARMSDNRWTIRSTELSKVLRIK